MPDHEFEKRIQEKMAELRVSPSVPVWDRVEKKLDEKEKRRRSLLWVPLLAAALLGFYFFIDSRTAIDRDLNENVEKTQETTKLPLAERKIRRHADKKSLNPQDRVIKDPELVLDTTARLSTASVNEPVTSHKPSLAAKPPHVFKQVEAGKLPRVEKQFSGAVEDESIPGTITKGLKETPEQAREHEWKENAGNPDRETMEETDKPVVHSMLKVSTAPFNKIDVFKQVRSPLAQQRVMKQALRRKKGWQFGLALNVGRSHVNNGKLANFLKSETVMDRSVAYLSNTLTAPANQQAGMGYIPPSRLKPGAALSAGGYVQKELSSKIRLSAGVNYKLYSSSNRIGTGKDSVLPATSSRNSLEKIMVYRTGNSGSYNNLFHYIELPVYVNGRLINGRFPIYWNTGISYSRLVASNALHYDGNYRLYYKDNKLLQKNQLNLQAGLTTEILSTSPHPLLLGPEFSYGLTSLFKANNADPKHFLFLGLKASMPLNNRF